MIQHLAVSLLLVIATMLLFLGLAFSKSKKVSAHSPKQTAFELGFTLTTAWFSVTGYRFGDSNTMHHCHTGCRSDVSALYLCTSTQSSLSGEPGCSTTKEA